MPLPRPALLALALLPITGCGSSVPSGPTTLLEVVTWEVAAHRTFCMADFPTSCLVVTEPGDANPRPLLGSVDGFAWQWGSGAELEVEVHEVPNPPQDGSSRRYVLRRLVRTAAAPAGTEFETPVDMSWPQLAPAGDGSYLLFGGRFYCVGAVDCAAFAAAATGDQDLRLRLAHSGVPGAPMTLVAWVTCPESGQAWDCPAIP